MGWLAADPAEGGQWERPCSLGSNPSSSATCALDLCTLKGEPLPPGLVTGVGRWEMQPGTARGHPQHAVPPPRGSLPCLPLTMLFPGFLV